MRVLYDRRPRALAKHSRQRSAQLARSTAAAAQRRCSQAVNATTTSRTTSRPPVNSDCSAASEPESALKRGTRAAEGREEQRKGRKAREARVGECEGGHLDEAVHDLSGRGLEGQVVDVAGLGVEPAADDAVDDDLGGHVDEEERVGADAHLLDCLRLGRRPAGQSGGTRERQGGGWRSTGGLERDQRAGGALDEGRYLCGEAGTSVREGCSPPVNRARVTPFCSAGLLTVTWASGRVVPHPRFGGCTGVGTRMHTRAAGLTGGSHRAASQRS